MTTATQEDPTLSRDFKGLWIPREIWLHPDLSLHAKCLWAEIYSLHDRNKGGCWASDDYLCNFLSLKTSRLYEIMKELKDLNLLEKVGFNGRTRFLKALVPPTNYGDGGKQLSGKPEPTLPENRNPDMRNPGITPIYRTKSENKDKEIAQSAAPLRQKDPEIAFSFDKRCFENINPKDLEDWKELYPNVDVPRELKEMTQWILANPSKARSKKLWRKFIVGWLQRQNEKSMNRTAYQTQKSQQQKQDVLSRHTGFQEDHRPRDPRKVKDFSNSPWIPLDTAHPSLHPKPPVQGQ